MYYVRESGERRCVHMMRYGVCCCDCMSAFMVMHVSLYADVCRVCSWGAGVVGMDGGCILCV